MTKDLKIDPDKIIEQHRKLLELMASECKKHGLHFYFYGYIRHGDDIAGATESHYNLRSNLRSYDACVVERGVRKDLRGIE